MSDLYLVLRSRLEAVKGEWVYVPSDVLRQARKARGLSIEAMGRELHCSAKTYERHEKDGRVPLDQVDRYAQVLGLQIERPAFSGAITVPAADPDRRGAGEGASADELLAVLLRMEEKQDRMGRELLELREAVARAQRSERRSSPRDGEAA
jgi:transcriptional regulator with XRE-family HTH domain